LQTTRNQVPIGIAAELGKWHDVVKAPSLGRQLTQTIKATATLSSVDGPPEGRGLQEILSLGVDGGEKGWRDGATSSIRLVAACSKDLVRQEHLNHMSGFAALHKAQEATRDEATDGPARRVAAKTDTARKPRNRKAEAGLSFQTAMPQEMWIDHAVGDGEPQAWSEQVLALFPDVFGVRFFVFHSSDPKWELEESRQGRDLRLKVES
jgi:hypothetical protein